MPLAITDVITPTTAAEIEQVVLDMCATGGLPTSAWQPGSMIRTFIEEQSAGFAAMSQRDVEIAKGGFGDLGSGVWVKYWAQSIYNVIFVPAAAATGGLTGTNASATQIDLNPGDLIVANKITGKTYRNQNTISILVGTSTTAGAILIASDGVGTANDAAPGDVTIVVNGIPGLTVTNPGPILGVDEETNDALVARTRAKLGSFSPNGPKGAYDYVATTPLASFPAVNGTTLTSTLTPFTRSKTTANRASGDITVYCATATGAPTQTDCDLVTLGLYRWAEPWCVDSQAAPAAEVPIPVVYQVWVRTSFTAQQVTDAIAIALSHYIATVPVGGVVVSPNTGRVYIEALQYVIRTAVPGIELVSIISPTTDIAISDVQVPVIGTISGTVTAL